MTEHIDYQLHRFIHAAAMQVPGPGWDWRCGGSNPKKYNRCDPAHRGRSAAQEQASHCDVDHGLGDIKAPLQLADEAASADCIQDRLRADTVSNVSSCQVHHQQAPIRVAPGARSQSLDRLAVDDSWRGARLARSPLALYRERQVANDAEQQHPSAAGTSRQEADRVEDFRQIVPGLCPRLGAVGSSDSICLHSSFVWSERYGLVFRAIQAVELRLSRVHIQSLNQPTPSRHDHCLTGSRDSLLSIPHTLSQERVSTLPKLE